MNGAERTPMPLDIQLPDLSDERFRRDVGTGRLNALVAFCAGVGTFLLTMRYHAEAGALAFMASYLVIPLVLGVGMLLERRFQTTKWIQATIVVALAKFVVTMTIHLMQGRILLFLHH